MTPPPVIDMARVIAYAILDSSVEWTGRQRLYSGGKLVGAVPRLALCQNTSGPLTDILLFHCNDEWEVLGASGGPTVEDAKAMAERAYRGITEKWIHTETTVEEADSWIREHHEDIICSFCDRPLEVDNRMFTGKSARICATCVKEFHKVMAESPVAEG